jgi:AGCS family alanine or glycine:cation symporter
MAEFLTKLDSILWGTPYLAFLLLIGLYFTLRSGFFQLTHFRHIMKNTLGSLFHGEGKKTSKASKDKLSPFEAMCIALGSCAGTGNIAGVASAIGIGGPGAIFWLWVWAIIGMIVKCVEVTLGCYYRSRDEKGNYYGGATYFIEKGIKIDKGIKIGGFLAGAFALGFFLQFLGGSQAYNLSEIIEQSFGINRIFFTVLYSILLWYLIWKGTPRIAKFSTKIVPFMTFAYIIGGIGIIIINFNTLPHVLYMIFHDAFTGTAAIGGFAGVTVSTAIKTGIARSMSSNGAGGGASPFIHGSADTIHPMRQGLWASFEVFADTIIACSITAFACLCTGAWETGAVGATLAVNSFELVYGRGGAYFMGIMAFLFAISTTTGWFTFYCAIIRYAFKKRPELADRLINVFKLVYPIPNIVIVSYIVLSGSGPDLFWTIVNLVLVIPTFTNMLSIFILRDKFWKIFSDYKARYLGNGQVDPSFYTFYDDDPSHAKLLKDEGYMV